MPPWEMIHRWTQINTDGQKWWHIYEETRDRSAPGRVGFGTLFAPQSLGRREGKECLGWLPTPPLVPKLHMPNALRSLDKAFFPFSPASGTHGAQKRAKAHSPGPFQGYARVSFLVSGLQACAAQAAERKLQKPILKASLAATFC